MIWNFKNYAPFWTFKRLSLLVLLSVVSVFVVSTCGEDSSTSPQVSNDAKASGTDTSTDTSTDTASESEVSTLTYQSFAKDLLDEACVPCHSSPPNEGAPSSFQLSSYEDEGSVKGVFSKRKIMRVRIADGTMPVAPYELSDEERTQLLAWLDADAPKGTETQTDEDTSTQTQVETETETETETDEETLLVPLLQFSSPSVAGESADASYQVTVSFTDVDASATWDLYYGTSSGATSQGTLITSGIAIQTQSYIWDTSSRSNGTYYLYAVLHNLNVDKSFAAPGSITVTHPPSNHSPTLSLTAPSANQFVLVGSTVNITYTSADSDNNTLTFKVEWSSDNGSTWTILTTSHTGNTFAWDTTGRSQGVRYKVRVTVDDGHGGSVSRTSNTFGIASSDISYTNAAATILQSKCSPCHDSGGSNSSSFVNTPYNAAQGPFAKRVTIGNVAVSGSSMPPGSAPNGTLTTDQKTILQLWLWNGAKE